MNQYSLERILRPITNKLSLMLGRAVIRALTTDNGKLQIDAEIFADDIVTKREYFTHHGLFSHPPIGSHCLIACPGGRREQARPAAISFSTPFIATPRAFASLRAACVARISADGEAIQRP